MSTATGDPADCKDIATAGLLDTVENGEVAVAISEADQPRTLSAQSGSEGPTSSPLPTVSRCELRFMDGQDRAVRARLAGALAVVHSTAASQR